MPAKLPIQGGICRLYYTPLENIAAWPAINPATQVASAQPTLVGGRQWYGPLNVPEASLGYTETLNTAKQGTTWKLAVEGIHPGESTASRVNMENMPYHRYAVVAKLRTGGMWILVGDKETGLDFSAKFTTGKGSKNVAETTFVFNGESPSNAIELPSFTP